MLHKHRFSNIWNPHQSKKISIHIIRQHVKHDTIAIYYCPAHEQRSADMESSNLQSEYATQGHRYICSL